MTPADILREYTGTDDREVVPVEVFADPESMGETLVAMMDEIERLREARDEKAKAVAQIVYDAEDRAWKPMRVFRSEADVERDEAIHDALCELADKVRREMEDTP